MVLSHLNYLSFNEVVSEVVGSWIVFMLLMFVFVTWLSLKNNLDFKTTIMLNVLVVFVVLTVVYQAGWLAIVLIALGFGIYGSYKRLIS